MTAALITLGIPALDRKLAELGGREANRICKSALNQGLTVLAKAEKAAVDADPDLSADMKAALKKTVGKRLVLKSARNQAIAAKAGLGVGQRPRGAKARARAADREATAAAQRGAKKRPGVGISSANVHWVVLGTQSRKTARGFNRGKMIPRRVIRRAAAQLPAVFARIALVARQKMDDTVRRLRAS